MAIIAPSFLAADFLQLGAACEMVNNSQADWYHLDVMDGVFVPNISFGQPIVASLCKQSTKYNDVHLMIEKPEKFIEDFVKAGANNITVHYEACTHLHRNIQQIKQLGIQAGVALNPHTPIGLLEEIICSVDIVCLMSVNPGFGGQKFIPETIQKIKALKQLIVAKNSKALIEIDGGVTLENATEIIQAGADVLVAGSSIFGANNPTEAIAALKAIA